MRDYGAQCVVWQTAINPVVALELLAETGPLAVSSANLTGRDAAISALDAERILVRSGPDEIAYLPGAQWGDRLPLLVQARLVQSLENAQLLAAVSRTGQGVSVDWSMSGEVRRFEIDAPAGQAVVEITVKLANNTNGRIVGAMVARGTAPGRAGKPEEAAAALDAALAVALRQIVAFVRGRV